MILAVSSLFDSNLIGGLEAELSIFINNQNSNSSFKASTLPIIHRSVNESIGLKIIFEIVEEVIYTSTKFELDLNSSRVRVSRGRGHAVGRGPMRRCGRHVVSSQDDRSAPDD